MKRPSRRVDKTSYAVRRVTISINVGYGGMGHAVVPDADLGASIERHMRDYSDGRHRFNVELIHQGIENLVRAAIKDALRKEAAATGAKYPSQVADREIRNVYVHVAESDAQTVSVKNVECVASPDGDHHRDNQGLCHQCGIEMPE
jgi:hypothetical protein